MNKEEISTHEITRFVTEVRTLLQHLDSDLVTELTSDLEANVSLSVADGEQIPNAHDYVQELLSAAGLEVPSIHKRSRYSLLERRVAQQLRGLAPMWWLLRAFIAVVVVSAISGGISTSTISRFPLLRVLGSPWTGIALFVLLLWGSVYLGRKQMPKRSRKYEILGGIFIVLGIALTYLVADRNYERSFDWLSRRDEFCKSVNSTWRSDAIEDLPNFTQLPNVVGMRAPVAEDVIFKWSDGKVGMFLNQDGTGPLPDYESALVSRQGSPQLHPGMCGSSIFVPVWIERGRDVTSQTLAPQQIPLVPTSMPADEQMYVIQEGDSPRSIADQFDISVDELLEFNGWKTEAQFPYPGSEIRIPRTTGDN